MLLLCNSGLQTANALDDFAFPTAPLLGRGKGKIATAGGTKLGGGRWRMGGRGQAGEDGWGPGGTVSAKEEFSSRLNWNWVANGPKQSSRVCCQKPCQGQECPCCLSLLAAPGVPLPVPVLRRTSPPGCSGHPNIPPAPGADHCFLFCCGSSPGWDLSQIVFCLFNWNRAD